MTRRLAVLGLLAGALVPGNAGAQSSGELAAEGIAAYRALEYGAAAALLRRALAAPTGDALPDTARARALIYLGATELLRHRPDAAAAAFREALATDPRHRADTLVFPPAITGAFDATRSETRYAAVRVPADTTIVPSRDRYPIRIHVSAPHDVRVTLRRTAGTTVASLYEGPVRDSMDVQWSGTDASGAPLDGPLTLEIASPAMGRVRFVEQQLAIRRIAHDVPVPAGTPSARPSPTSRPRGGLRALAGGVLAAAAVVALPALVSPDTPGTPQRYAVGAALGLGGILGLLGGARSEHPDPPPMVRPPVPASELARDVRVRIVAPAPPTTREEP